jgi:coenzyme F420-reducing hydrogenase gamma subunit
MPDPTRMAKPRVAIHKFSSCDGCQLALLNAGEALLQVAQLVDIVHFAEAGPVDPEARVDIAFVEGSISTPEEAERIRKVRASSTYLVSIGACATAGGIQALRNFADVREFTAAVYATPGYIATLETSTPISQHVRVDLELRGCPISKSQLVETLLALLHGRRPNLPSYSVCLECKRRGTPCVMVARGTPCLGPVTQAGCGALCPAYSRGCFGCFGPMESPNTSALGEIWRSWGVSDPDLMRAFRSFNAWAPPFRAASESHERKTR